jgi:hypothetical protein
MKTANRGKGCGSGRSHGRNPVSAANQDTIPANLANSIKVEGIRAESERPALR